MIKVAFLFILPAFLMAASASAQEKTAEAVISKAFASIKNNDEQAFMKLYPTYPQLKNLFAEMATQVTDSVTRESFNQATSHMTEELYNSDLKGKTIQAFQKVVAIGREMGIDWTRAAMDSFRMVEQHEPGFEVKSMMGYVYFSDNGKQFTIPFSEIIWSAQQQGWFGFTMNTILKKGKVISNEDTGVKMQDVELSTTVDAPEPPPPPKKPVAKKAATQKTPAKKPVPKKTSTPAKVRS